MTDENKIHSSSTNTPSTCRKDSEEEFECEVKCPYAADIDDNEDENNDDEEEESEEEDVDGNKDV